MKRFYFLLIAILIASPAWAQVQRVDTPNEGGLKNVGSPLSVLLELDLENYQNGGQIKFDDTQSILFGDGFAYSSDTGNITLKKPGAGIITTPGPAPGAVVLDEIAGNGGNTFTFGVQGNLSQDYSCEINSSGNWIGDCPSGGGGGGGEGLMSAKGWLASVQPLSMVTLSELQGVGQYDLVQVKNSDYQLMSQLVAEPGVPFNGSASDGRQWIFPVGYKYSVAVKMGRTPYCSFTLYGDAPDYPVLGYPGQNNPEAESPTQTNPWPYAHMQDVYFEVDATTEEHSMGLWGDGPL